MRSMTHRNIFLLAVILQVSQGQIQTTSYSLQPNSLQYYYPAGSQEPQEVSSYTQQVAYAVPAHVGHYAPVRYIAMAIVAPQSQAVPGQGAVQYVQYNPAYAQPSAAQPSQVFSAQVATAPQPAQVASAPQAAQVASAPQAAQVASVQISHAQNSQPQVAPQAASASPYPAATPGFFRQNPQYSFQYQVQHAPTGDSKFQLQTHSDLVQTSSAFPVPGFFGNSLDYSNDLVNRFNAVNKVETSQQNTDPTTVTVTKSLELSPLSNVQNKLQQPVGVSQQAQPAASVQSTETSSTPQPESVFSQNQSDISRPSQPISAPPQVPAANYAPVSTSTPSPTASPAPQLAAASQLAAAPQLAPAPQQYNTPLQFNYAHPIIQH